ncbi:MAG: molybdate ABC transporter substrate-binding protein [Thermoanaerobaculia bacterium]
MTRLLALFAAGILFAVGAPADSGPTRPREVRVAAAADLQFALDEVFRAAGRSIAGIRPVVIYGSSGSIHAQIENGAPFDLFLSADADYPRRLAAKGFADGAVFHYAVGRLAVWVPSASRLDVGALGLRALLAPSVRKVAIANPRHAPYGRAAEAAMRHLGVRDGLREKLVLGESVAQAAQFAKSGAADAGILALSLVLSPRMRDSGRWAEVPRNAYPRMDQGGIVLRHARDLAGARALRDALLSPRGREVLVSRGFALPDP